MKRVEKLKIGKADIDVYLEKIIFYIDYRNIEIDDFDTKKKFDEILIEKMKLDKLVFDRYKNVAIEKIKKMLEERNIGLNEGKYRVTFTIDMFCVVFFKDEKIMMRLLKFYVRILKLFKFGFFKKYYWIYSDDIDEYDKFFLKLDDEVKKRILLELI